MIAAETPRQRTIWHGHQQALAMSRLRLSRLRNRYRMTRRIRWTRLGLQIALFGPVGILLLFSSILATAVGFGKAPSAEVADDLFASMLVISFATMVAGCLGVALQSLYFSREGDFFLTLPLSFRLILLARTGDFVRGAAPGTLFGIATSVGYVLARAQWTGAIVTTVPALLVLAGLAIGIAVVLTATVVLLTPARHTRTALTVLGLATLCSAGWAWQGLGRPNLFTGAGQPSQPISPWLELLPPVWIARGISNLSAGSILAASLYAGLACAALAVLLAGAARLYEATYAIPPGYADLPPGRPTPRRIGYLAQTLLKVIPGSVIHWVRREWTLIERDFSRVSAALWPITAILIVIGSTLILNRDANTHDSTEFWRVHAAVLLLPWAMSLGTTIYAIGSEPDEFGLPRSLPTRSLTMMIGKYAAYAIPTAFFSSAVGVLTLAAAPGNTADSSLLLLLLIWLACGSCSIDLAMSAAAPRFGAEPIQRTTPFTSRILAAALGLLTMILAVMALAISPIGNRSIGVALGIDSLDPGTGGWIFALVISLLVPATMLVTGTRRLSQLLAGA